MDLVVLHEEITSDPAGRGYAAMTDEVVAAALNARDIVRYREVPLVAVTRELIMMSDQNGRFVWDNVTDAAADPAHAAHDLARRLCFLFNGGLPVNWGGSAAGQMLAAAVAAGFFTTAQAEIFRDTGRELVSRADILGLEPVRVGHVMEVRAINGGEGND